MRLIRLSNAFYDKYETCDEILKKRSRPYVCLLIKIDEVTFAIPFRHHIAHEHAFFTYDDCGIDYTKAIVLSDPSFVSDSVPQIEQKEFNALKGKDHLIVNGMRKYLGLYKKAVQHSDNPHYSKILRFSSLQYFHKELGI
mgnify:CR=1 FL=1